MLNLRNFKLNEEGIFSITRPYESSQIIYLIDNFIKCVEGSNLSTFVVTDATACMGGDTVRFAKYFKTVNAVELIPANFELLTYNCNYFRCDNVILFNNDYTEIYENLVQDVIYLDPPWGGTTYKNLEQVRLSLGDLDLSTLINLIKSKNLTKFVFVKVPMNICLDGIDYDSMHVIYNKSNIASFKLVCISLINVAWRNTNW